MSREKLFQANVHNNKQYQETLNGGIPCKLPTIKIVAKEAQKNFFRPWKTITYTVIKINKQLLSYLPGPASSDGKALTS